MKRLLASLALCSLLLAAGCQSRNVETGDNTTPSNGVVPGQQPQ